MSPTPEGTCTVSQNVPSGLTVSFVKYTEIHFKEHHPLMIKHWAKLSQRIPCLQLGIISFFTHNSTIMDILFCSSWCNNEFITTKFCTCHDSIAVVTSAKICRNEMVKISIIAKHNLHWIWIVRQKASVKWAPVWNVFDLDLCGMSCSRSATCSLGLIWKKELDPKPCYHWLSAKTGNSIAN